MIISNVSEEVFKVTENDFLEILRNNFEKEIIKKLYFIPKRIDASMIDEKLQDKSYMDKVLNTIKYFKDKDIEKLVFDKFKSFEEDTGYELTGGKVYIIIGLDTTTIYSTVVDGEEVTVLLLEATSGDEEVLDMLLAHEFTHFIRKQLLKKDIFEEAIGERFITEGIASNYSREIVPGRVDSDYCIVKDETVRWVKSNIEKIESYMNGKKDRSELMRDYFYMYVDTSITGMPARVGYVYGYLKIKEYLEKNNLMVKDILGIDWKKIIGD